MRAGGTLPPVFCIPGIGGSLMGFSPLAESFGPEQPVYGLRPRGSDGGELPHAKIVDWAADNIGAIGSIQPQGPYHLVGHSLGGVLLSTWPGNWRPPARRSGGWR